MAPLTIPLNDGKQIPWLGFGTGTALYGKDAESAIKVAIANGIIHLDGAQLYGNEDSLGNGIAASGKSRAELFVTTKLGKLPEGKTVRDTLVESLKKLKLDYVDLFLIHMPIHHEGKLKAVWKEFEELKKEGLAKSIGVSNFRVKDFEELLDGATVVPAVNQVSRSACTIVWNDIRRDFSCGRLSSILTSTRRLPPCLSSRRNTTSLRRLMAA